MLSTGASVNGLSAIAFVPPLGLCSLLNRNRFRLVGLFGDRIESRTPIPIDFSTGVAGELASCPNSSDRSSIEYAAPPSSLLSLDCAMFAPDGDRSSRANPARFELDRLGMNLSLYEVRVGDEVLAVPTICFIGDPNPCHDRLAIVSRCSTSRDMPTGRLRHRATLLCSPSSRMPSAPSMGWSIYSVFSAIARGAEGPFLRAGSQQRECDLHVHFT